jgi:hypothetical protein
VGAGGDGTGGMAARAAPQPPDSTGAGGGDAGTGDIGTGGGDVGAGRGAITGGATGVDWKPFIVVGAVAVTGRAPRAGSGGRSGVGRTSGSVCGRCDGNLGSCGCSCCIGELRHGSGAMAGSVAVAVRLPFASQPPEGAAPSSGTG